MMTGGFQVKKGSKPLTQITQRSWECENARGLNRTEAETVTSKCSKCCVYKVTDLYGGRRRDCGGHELSTSRSWTKQKEVVHPNPTKQIKRSGLVCGSQI